MDTSKPCLCRLLPAEPLTLCSFAARAPPLAPVVSDDLKAELLAFQQQRQAGGGQRLVCEAVRPFDATAYAQATRPPQTMRSFFAPKGAAAVAATAAAKPAAAARPAAAAKPAAAAAKPAAEGKRAVASKPAAQSAAGQSHFFAPSPSGAAATSSAAASASCVMDLTSGSPTKGDADLARRMQAQYDKEVGRPSAALSTLPATTQMGLAAALGGRGGLGGRGAPGERGTPPPASAERGGRGGAQGRAGGKATVGSKAQAAPGAGTSGDGAKKRKSILELMREQQMRKVE